MAKSTAIIVAAGSGTRMESETPKQFLTLNGIPILTLTLLQFQNCTEIDAIILVHPPEYEEIIHRDVLRDYGIDKPVYLVPGGAERHDSVKNGLEIASVENEIILVHDGVRPFIRKKLIRESIFACREHSAAIVALKTRDTIKYANKAGFIEKTIPREFLWQAQTPQVFRREILISAFEKAHTLNIKGTDEAMLVEHLDIPVFLIHGDPYNIKITTPDDLMMAEAFYPFFRKLDS